VAATAAEAASLTLAVAVLAAEPAVATAALTAAPTTPPAESADGGVDEAAPPALCR
jgi:hypothetical protein